MSSDSSDSEYEGRNHKTNSDSDSDPHVRRTDGSAKGPQTPKSCSPRSPISPTSPKSLRSIASPRSPKSPRTPASLRSPRSPRSPRTPRTPRSQDSPIRSQGFQDDSRGPASPLSDSQDPVSLQGGRGPRSPPSPAPPDNVDDDGRSDISSGSSLLSHQDNKDEDLLNLEPGEAEASPVASKTSPLSKTFPISTADDLSDVSDLDDSDGLEDKDPQENHVNDYENKKSEDMKDRSEDKIVKETKEREAREKAEKERQEREKKNSLNMDDGEQLDFEAEDQPDVEKEDGEIDMGEKGKDKDDDDKSADEGEVKEDEESLEDGEVTDEGDPKPEKPPVCRFYSRGACTWGINCRFLHPGVTDKGNYTMFDVGRPMVAPPNGPALYPPEHRPPYGHPIIIAPSRVLPSPYGPVPARREEPSLVESAWERGLRQAKEMMRKSTKRKETDMDFEEKKMNLSIGQDEIDKENDYYTRAASPVDEPEGWVRLSPKLEQELRRPVRVVERYEDIIPEPGSPTYYDKYEYRRGYEARSKDVEFVRREKKKYYDEEEYPAAKKPRREKMVREVIVQRSEKPRERHHAEDGSRRRPDEWSDPWMRSKSPSRKAGGHRPRKTSYSSGSSSFSSRSGSRSSSNSTYSSYSRSRSRSLSNSRSPVSRSRKPRTPPFATKVRSKKPSPPKDNKFRPLKSATPVGGHPEKKVTVERTMLMNPPAPTPKRTKERPLSPTAMRKVGLNPPPPTPKLSSKNPLKHSNSAKTGKVRPRKSRSSSGSGSSGSSSESSRSSYSSSSSSSRGGTPPVRPGKPAKKIEPNERLAAQAMKGKAMDALKVSGQKPQIKLTLKPPEAKREKPTPPLVASKKRPAEDAPAPDPKQVITAVKPPAPKKTTSRREELLKQLKAVEDAIARKRSKI